MTEHWPILPAKAAWNTCVSCQCKLNDATCSHKINTFPQYIHLLSLNIDMVQINWGIFEIYLQPKLASYEICSSISVLRFFCLSFFKTFPCFLVEKSLYKLVNNFLPLYVVPSLLFTNLAYFYHSMWYPLYYS